MSANAEAVGRTIQLFLVDGSPSGLIIASIHGWTGTVLVATQTTFGQLLARPEADRTGIYILFGPDPESSLAMRAYIGEADNVRDRIDRSANRRGFWETAIVVTTSDEALTKGHVRYLEARLIELTIAAGRITLDNSQKPPTERRHLPEADQANMEAFIANLKVILPVVGLDLLKPKPRITPVSAGEPDSTADSGTRFEVRHKSGVKALAVETDDEFVVLAGSHALKDTNYAHNAYASLKEELISKGILVSTDDGGMFQFTESYSFKSPSAAGSVILDRNTNGRTRWFVVGAKLNYHQWQEEKARGLKGEA